MKLSYDQEKNNRNIHERGLSFDMVYHFDFTTALFWEDTRQDYQETRYCALGMIEGRLHALVFTPRGETVRVISLRKANKREVSEYEQRKPNMDG
jgi:uncharacterized DUF497 family protein